DEAVPPVVRRVEGDDARDGPDPVDAELLVGAEVGLDAGTPGGLRAGDDVGELGHDLLPCVRKRTGQAYASDRGSRYRRPLRPVGADAAGADPRRRARGRRARRLRPGRRCSAGSHRPGPPPGSGWRRDRWCRRPWRRRPRPPGRWATTSARAWGWAWALRWAWASAWGRGR